MRALWTSTYGHMSVGVNNKISVFVGVLEEHLRVLCLFNLAHPIKLLSSRKDLGRLQSRLLVFRSEQMLQ